MSKRAVGNGRRERKQTRLNERKLTLRSRWYAGGVATVIAGALMFTGYMPAMADDSSGGDAGATPGASQTPTPTPSADSTATDSTATDAATSTPAPSPSATTSGGDSSKTTPSTGTSGGTKSTRSLNAAVTSPSPTPSPSSSSPTNTITVQKKIEDANGIISATNPDANGWSFSGTTTDGTIGNGGAFPLTATVNGVIGIATQTISIPQGSNPTVKITENMTPAQQSGYVLDTGNSSCTVGGVPVVISWSGTSGSFTAASNQAISCIFVNKVAPSYKVTVIKNWADNAISGDQAKLALTGTAGIISTAPTNGTSITNTFHVGDQVTVGETPLAGDKGVYSTELNCTGATPDPFSSFTMPANDVTCTFLNTNGAAKITLVKTWVDALVGDSAKLNIGEDAGTTSTVTGNTGTSFTDTANTDSATLPIGSEVTIQEVLSGAGTYDTTWVCVDNYGRTIASGTGTSGMVQVAAGGVDCTITNKAKMITVTLHKQWQNAVAGDTTDLTLTGNGLTQSFTSTAEAGASFTDPNFVSITVPVGTQIGATETTPTGTGSYSSMFACDNGATGTPFTATVDTNCTYTNANGGVIVKLQKDWVSSFSGDTADLLINDTAGATSTAAGSPTNQLDTTNVAQASVHVGDDVTIGEDLHLTVPGSSYTSTFVCVDSEGLTVASGDSSSGGFTVPESLAGTTVTCTIFNTVETSTVTVNKQWINGLGGDVATLTLTPTPGSPMSGTSTVGGPIGDVKASQLDTDVASITAPIGATATLAEVLSGTGSYDTEYACVTNIGAQSVPYTAIPVVAGGVTCTVTNTRSTVDVGIVKTSSTAGPVDDDPGVTSEFSYTLTVTNHSTQAITNATVTDPLPKALLSLDTSKGTGGLVLPAGWTASVADESLTVNIPSMAVGESDDITVFVVVKPVVETVQSVPPVSPDGTPTAPPAVTPPDSIDNTACVALEGDTNPANNCSTVKVPQKAVLANLWVQCQGDIPYLGYTITTTANIANEPVTMTWTASQPGTGGVPATDLPPDPAQLTFNLHSGDSGRILWPGGEVLNNVGVGFPGWRPLVASDYNPDGTLKNPSALTFAGLIYDPATVATDAWRYQSTVTIKVNPTSTATVTYPPASVACAVARTPKITITKTASVAQTSPGASFSYNVVVKDTGLGAASPVAISDPIPADLKVTGISTSTSAFPRWQGCAVTGQDAAGYGGTLHCDLFGPLKLNETAPPITLDVLVNKGTTVNTITNTATVCWTNMDDTSEKGCAPASATVTLGTLPVTGGTPAFGLIGVAFLAILTGIGAIIVTRRRRRDELS